jgi:hypothetical protein
MPTPHLLILCLVHSTLGAFVSHPQLTPPTETTLSDETQVHRRHGSGILVPRQRPTRSAHTTFPRGPHQPHPSRHEHRLHLRPPPGRNRRSYNPDREVGRRRVAQHAVVAVAAGPLQLRNDDREGGHDQDGESYGVEAPRSVSHSRGELLDQELPPQFELRDSVLEREVQVDVGTEEDRHEEEVLLCDVYTECCREVRLILNLEKTQIFRRAYFRD